MTRRGSLLALRLIPGTAARQTEAEARRKYSSRAAAYEDAEYQIVWAPGTYGSADAPTYGWVLTRAAANALNGEQVRMPGNTQHDSWAVRYWPCS